MTSFFSRRVGFYPLVVAAIVLSMGVLTFVFQHQLNESTAQLVGAFRADNARALAAADLPVITSRLDALMSSVNWVCISAARGREVFFEQRRGFCASSFFQRNVPLTTANQSDINVVLTLRLPRTLERAFLTELCLQLFCLGVIFWATKMEEVKRADLLAGLSSQVAHDIRSPLATLDSALDDALQLPERKRIMIRSALNRIRDIANKLRDNQVQPRSLGTASAGDGSLLPSGQLLSSLIDSLMSDKRVEFHSRGGIEIDFPLNEASYGLFASVHPNEFKTVQSNLINNAVEALGEKGQVRIAMSRDTDGILIQVRDNGKGIPREILAKLGNRGETHGKAGGSGLGLYHARTAVESWGGRLRIESEVGKGTTVLVSLPAVAPPVWFISKLEFQPGGTVVVLDDEASIHSLWRARFDRLRAGDHGIEVIYLHTADEERAWVGKNPEKARAARYLTDYELIGQQATGLELVEELGISDRAILVTSRFEDEGILDRCRRRGVRMIPKSLAGFVPMSVRTAETSNGTGNRVDAVLIDDDELARYTWEVSAEQHGKVLRTFTTSKEFIAIAESLEKDTAIYVDAELQNGQQGSDFAKELYSLGFSNLYMATGHPPEKFADMPWIKEVRGKSPPWNA